MDLEQKMEILIEESLEIERSILIIIVGLLESLSQDAITIEDAERALFSPYGYGVLHDLEVNSTILSLVENGTLLENFKSLLPHELNKEIDKMKQIAIQELSSLSPRSTYEHWLHTEEEPSENDVFVTEDDEEAESNDDDKE